VIGTPTYMAPEQMVSARSTDTRSDIWSIGVVMYQMLAGRPPFEAETYAQLVLKVGTSPPNPLHVALPPGLQDIVFRCLEKDPQRRMQSVGELARMLAPYASDPHAASQAAERATRILTSPRASQPSFALGGQGGLSMTPQALTPKSWNKSSVSGSAGQLGTRHTKEMRGGRGLVITGVATLVVLAGVGGFFIAGTMKRESKHTGAATEPTPAKQEMKVSTEPPKPQPTVKPPVPEPVQAKDTKTKTDTRTDTKSANAETKTDPKSAKTEIRTDPKSADTKSAKTETKTDAKSDTKTDAKTDAKSDTKTDAKTDAKTATDVKTEIARGDDSKKKSTKTKKKSTKTDKPEDDLFDDRK
jgi:serine/threonine protein kinase